MLSRLVLKNNNKTTAPLKCGRNCVKYLSLNNTKKNERNIYKIAKQDSYNAINKVTKIKKSADNIPAETFQRLTSPESQDHYRSSQARIT